MESETKAFLEKAKGIYTRISSNEFAVRIWQEVLKNITYDNCCKALIKYITEDGSHDPKPGDILRIAKSTYEPIKTRISIPCEKCHGTGYVFLIDEEKHESMGACDCPNGAAHPGLPIITKMYCKFDEIGRVKI